MAVRPDDAPSGQAATLHSEEASLRISVLIDQFHIDVWVPRGLARQEARAITRVLNSKAFRARLTATIRSVVQHYPSLKQTTFRLSR